MFNGSWAFGTALGGACDGLAPSVNKACRLGELEHAVSVEVLELLQGAVVVLARTKCGPCLQENVFEKGLLQQGTGARDKVLCFRDAVQWLVTVAVVVVAGVGSVFWGFAVLGSGGSSQDFAGWHAWANTKQEAEAFEQALDLLWDMGHGDKHER